MSSNTKIRRPLGRLCTSALAISCAIGVLPDAAMAAVNPIQQSQPDALTKARDYIKSGNISAAMIELKNLIRANPKLIDARVELANLYVQTNDGVAAEKEWRAALQSGYPFEKALDGLGLSLLMQGQAQRLLKEFDPAKNTGELTTRVHLFRAQAHMSLTEVALARQEVASAQAISPTYFGVYLASSRFHQIDGDLKAAESDIDQALTLSPDNVDVLLQKGEIRGAQGDAVGAQKYFDRVLAHNKSDLRARLGRAAALVSQRQTESADTEINDILRLAPGSPVATYFKALLLAQKGKKDDALALLSRINGIEKLPPALYLLAALHLAKGELEQAQRYIGAYVAKAPDDVRGQLLQIALQLARGEVTASVPKLEAIKSKLPNDYTTSLLLGNAYLSLGRFSDATTQFQSATAASPQGSEASMGLAESLLGQGKADEGAKILQALSAQGLGGGRTDALLVISLLKARNLDAAFKAATDYSTKEPKNAAPLYLRASVDAARDDRAATRNDLNAALKIDPAFVPAHLALALLDRSEGKPEDARAHYQSALAKAPSNLDAHIGMATLALDSGDKQGAVDWLKKAAVANPSTPSPSLLVINLLLVQRRIDDALKEASELALKFPANALAIDALGVCQLAHHDGAGAVTTFGKLVGLMPNSAVANIKLAAAYRMATRPQDARKSLEAALKIDASSQEAHRALIDLVFAQDGAEAALKMAQAARGTIADKNVADLIVADTFRLVGKPAEAEAIYKDLWKKTQSTPLLVRYTQTLEGQGKLPASRAIIQDWLKTHQSDSSARFLLVVNSINASQYATALTEGESLLKDRPTDIALLNNVAWLYAQTGNMPKAVEFAEKAYAQATWSPEVGDTLGWLLVKSGKLERGLGLLKTAHDLAPQSAEISYHYAFALNQSGKAAEARSLLSVALKSKQSFTERKDAEKFLLTLH